MKVYHPSEKLTSLKTQILQLQLTLELSQIHQILSAYSDLLLFFAEYSFLFINDSTQTPVLNDKHSNFEGCFITVDPIRDGNNWYAYVHNDPVNCVDLWGLTASDSGSINFPIRSGDVLSQITKDHNYRYGTDYTAEEIAAMNGIANPDLIYAGNSLKLPVPATSPYASSVSENKKESTAMVPAVQEQKGGPVITVGVSANFVFGVGADVSFGLQFDLGNPDNSGIVVGGGFAAGASIGAGGFISISPVSSEDNLVSGSTGIMLSPVSVGVGLSNNGDLTVTGGIGTGFGFYNSIEHSSFTSFSDFSESFIDSLSTLKLPY